MVFFGLSNRLLRSFSSGDWHDSERVKNNVIHSKNVVLLFEDGHAEARWPESPNTWSYYVSIDAALIAAELRGYHVKR